MSITIGETTLATAEPADLDKALLQATGCNAEEAQRWLKGHPRPHLVAAALKPFLTGDELPSDAELAVMIADAGSAQVAGEVAALYVPSPVEQPTLLAEAHGGAA